MIDTIEQKRNGIDYTSKGDKPYKTPEYQTVNIILYIYL